MQLKIQHLQWLGASVIATVCLMLAGTIIFANTSKYLAAKRGAAEFSRYEAALRVGWAISTERGPANSAMAAPEDTQKEFVEALARKRAETDEELRQVESMFSNEIEHSPSLRAAFRSVRLQLGTGRFAVDSVVNKPSSERQGGRVAAAIESMFSAADRAHELREKLGSAIIEDSPEIGVQVMLSATASVLRDRAGRIGSYVVMMLANDSRAAERYLPDFNREMAQVADLHESLKTYSTSYFHAYPIDQVLSEVDVAFVYGSLAYAQQMAYLGAKAYRPTAVEFTEKFMPGLQSTENLRELILSSAESTMTTAQSNALRDVVLSATLVTVAVAVLIALAYLLRKALFRPLIAARRQITAIARGDLTQPPQMRGVGTELLDMFRGLDFLRQQQRLKRQLEFDREKMADKLKLLSQTDSLTGLLNRRALNEAVHEMFVQSDLNGFAIGVVMLDVDHFKAINDRHGHAAGDDVLQMVAARLRTLLREQDILGRYGGEEFIVVLKDVAESDANGAAERMRQMLEHTIFGENGNVTVTASFGVAWRAGGAAIDWEQLVRAADKRLYRAKRAGRNRVCFDDVDITPGETEPKSNSRRKQDAASRLAAA